MRTIHFVTEHYPPTKGGLEQRTQRLVKFFRASGYTVYVHIMAMDNNLEYYTSAGDDGYLKLPMRENAILIDPLKHSTTNAQHLIMETSRVEFITLRNSVLNVIESSPDGVSHIIVSNFITRVGFTSALVAEDLNIKHVASVVGTDFSRGIRNHIERGIFDFVTSRADKIVTLNYEQANTIKKLFKPAADMVTIHGSVDMGESLRIANKYIDHIHLYCDGGYSNKKGTQVLFDAFCRLADEGLPVKLTVCGNTALGQEAYWMRYRNELNERFGKRVSLYDFLPEEQIKNIALNSHVYCLPTLGEGCSSARIKALNLGLPIVTTICGEMPDIVGSASHIRMVLPGEVHNFYMALRLIIIQIMHNELTIDQQYIDNWNVYFLREREYADWKNVIDNI